MRFSIWPVIVVYLIANYLCYGAGAISARKQLQFEGLLPGGRKDAVVGPIAHLSIVSAENQHLTVDGTPRALVSGNSSFCNSSGYLLAAS